MMGKTTLLVAETSPPKLGEILPNLFTDPDYQIEVYTTLIPELIKAYSKYQPQLVLIVGNDHIASLVQLKQQAPQVKVLLLVDTLRLAEGQLALKMGAVGYLVQSTFLENPVTLINTAIAGKIIFPKELIDQLFS